MERCLLDLPDHIILENILAELIPYATMGYHTTDPNDLRDILSAASTCTRIHELASHPSLWRNVNAGMFSGRFETAARDCVAPPPLPLGAVHCGVFDRYLFDVCDGYCLPLLELLSSMVEFRAYFDNDLSVDDCVRLARAISAMRSLESFEITAPGIVEALTAVTLPERLSNLSLSTPGPLRALFAGRKFSSLLSIAVAIEEPLDFVGCADAIAAACPSLGAAEITFARGRYTVRDISPLWTRCSALVRLRLVAKMDAHFGETDCIGTVPPALTVVDLDVHMGRCDFLALFPNLLSLRLKVDAATTESDIAAVSSMRALSNLTIDFATEAADSCAKLLPLVRSSCSDGTFERKSLKSLAISNSRADMSEFMISRWCSRLEELSLRPFPAEWKAESSPWSSDNVAFESSLRKLTLVTTKDAEIPGDHMGSFISRFPLLEDLWMEGFGDGDNMNVFFAVLGCGSSAKLRSLRVTQGHNTPLDISPALHMLVHAESVYLDLSVTQSTVDSIATVSPNLHNFHVTKYQNQGIRIPTNFQ